MNGLPGSTWVATREQGRSRYTPWSAGQTIPRPSRAASFTPVGRKEAGSRCAGVSTAGGIDL